LAQLRARLEFEYSAEQYAALRVAFPHGIGCGLAGGDWREYRAALERWADSVPFSVYTVKLPTAK
jgi:hypothetical protein